MTKKKLSGSLPEEYIVKCNSKEECREVRGNYYTKDSVSSTLAHWDYIICCQRFTNANGTGTSQSFHWCIYPEVSQLPVFTYSEWKALIEDDNFVLPEKWCIKWTSEEVFNACCKYFKKDWVYYEDSYSVSPSRVYYGNYWSFAEERVPQSEGYVEITYKQFLKYVVNTTESINQTNSKIMKEDFTVEGSKALKEAFVNELGLKFHNSGSINYNYLCTCSNGTIQGSYSKESTHYKLPSQWNEAITAAKKYYFEPEKKVHKVRFAELELTITEGDDFAVSTHGKIYKKDVQSLINIIEYKNVEICGYTAKLNNSANIIEFGCQKGTVSQAYDVLNAFNF